tara:strand:- start:8174 stop:9301 length:1128 start_codon:yes stop_codon:yes gene_type:complete
MNTDSTKILSFLSNYKIRSFKVDNTLNDFYNYVKDHYKHINFDVVNSVCVTSDVPHNSNYIADIYNQFCSKHIQKDIEQTELSICNTTIQLKSKQINLSVCNGTEQSKIIHTAAFILTLFKTDISHLNMKLYLNSNKKQLPPSYKMLTEHEINTGSTILGPSMGQITIWRKEELVRIILHEVIHYLNYDINFYNYPKQERYIIDYIHKHFDIPLDTELRINESYVETSACILNSMLASKNMKDFVKLLNQERLFALFQIAKILKFYGYKNVSEFYNPKGITIRTNRWRQNTSVFSYFVIKGALLFSINKFIDYCYKNNGSELLVFKKMKYSFYRLVKDCLENSTFMNKIDQFMKVKLDKHSIVYKTLRMTVIELQ